MEPLRPIRWREGMFLRPHHLQQHDRFLEARQIAYLEATTHFGWGLVHLEINEDALNNFVLDVRALRAVLADGTLIDVPGNSRMPSRNVNPKSLDPSTPTEILLGVRRIEERRPRTLDEGAGKGETRFLPVIDEMFDLDTGKDSAAIEQMEYDVQLFLASEPTQGYEVMPVCSLTSTGNPSTPLVLTPGFAPPTLVLSASPALHGAARSVVERLATVIRKLDEIRASEKVRELILYQALTGCLPVLRDMVGLGNVHPRQCYQEMARLAGTLFYRDEQARSFDDIPEYDHRVPGPVFERLRSLIQELSEPLFAQTYRRIPMERDGDSYRAAVPAEAKAPGTRLFFEVEAPDSAPKLRTLFLQARVSGPSRIEHLTRFALPGIATEMQNAPPPQLPPGQTGAYFRLKTDEGTEWSTHVVPAGELVAFLLGAPHDVKISLLLTFPRT